jgi:hypothetical protein
LVRQSHQFLRRDWVTPYQKMWLMRHESVNVAGQVTPWNLVAPVRMARLLHKSHQPDWRDSKEPDLKKKMADSFLKYWLKRPKNPWDTLSMWRHACASTTLLCLATVVARHPGAGRREEDLPTPLAAVEFESGPSTRLPPSCYLDRNMPTSWMKSYSFCFSCTSILCCLMTRN